MFGEYDYKVVKVVAAYNNKTVLELSDLRLIPSDEFIQLEFVPDEFVQQEYTPQDFLKK